jgi:hypothetical protein
VTDTVYRVRTVYEVESAQAHANVGKLSGAFDSLGAYADKVGGAMDAVAGRIFNVGAAMAAVAGAGAIAAVKTGLVDINAGLEDAKLGFATVFNILGNTGMSGGLALAGGLIEQIRDDAKSLPGEFQDFVSMAQNLAAPLINAGKSVEDIRDLTRDTVVAAAGLKVPFEQAAREMAMLVEGHAGGHNILGNKLGINAHTLLGNGKEFNKATDVERIAFITNKLQNAKDALPAFSKSWSGLTSTLTDSVKQLLGRATTPLFEKVKTDLERMIALTDSARARRLADSVGHELVEAHDKVVHAIDYIHDNWYRIRGFAREVHDDLISAFHIVEPIAKRLGQELEHPSKALKELVGLRLGIGALQAGAPIGSHLFSMSQAASAAKSAGKVANGAKEVAGVSDVAAYGIGGLSKVNHETDMAVHLAGGGGLFDAGAPLGLPGIPVAAGGGEAAAGAAAGAAGGLAAVSIAALAAVGAIDVLANSGKEAGLLVYKEHQAGQDVWRDIKDNFGSAIKETTKYLSDLWAVLQPVADVLGIALLGAIDGVAYAFRALTWPMRTLASAIRSVISMIPGFSSKDGDGNEVHSVGDVMQNKKQWVPKEISRDKLDAELAAIDALNAASKKMPGAGKVNVTVNAPLTVLSDADPERLAKKVAYEINDKMRNALSSHSLAASRAF